MTHVTRELFGFLRELRRHNNREWFNANKERYLGEVRDPLLAFIQAIVPRLTRISPHIVADPRPSGGSLLRIYRDTRFSRDKTPYKTNAGLSFGLDAPRDFDAPGYYLHLAPGEVFMGAGIWRPSADALRAIREAIVKDPRGWRRATRSGLSHGEATLKRSPRGFDPDHPLSDDLKRLSFTAGVEFSERQACAPQIPLESVQDLLASGLIRIGNPRRYGGHDVEVDTAFDVGFELGRGCGSTAWCYSLWTAHNWWLGHFPEQAQEEFFATGPDTLFSSGLNPAGGKVESASGGFRVSGRWGFSRGCDAATPVMVAVPRSRPHAPGWLP